MPPGFRRRQSRDLIAEKSWHRLHRARSGPVDAFMAKRVTIEADYTDVVVGSLRQKTARSVTFTPKVLVEYATLNT